MRSIQSHRFNVGGQINSGFRFNSPRQSKIIENFVVFSVTNRMLRQSSLSGIWCLKTSRQDFSEPSPPFLNQALLTSFNTGGSRILRFRGRDNLTLGGIRTTFHTSFLIYSWLFPTIKLSHYPMGIIVCTSQFARGGCPLPIRRCFVCSGGVYPRLLMRSRSRKSPTQVIMISI